MVSPFRLALAFAGALLSGCVSRVAQVPSPAPAHRAPFAWPNGATAAVSLTYDDALPSQLDHAAPALTRHGLVATFFLTGTSPTLQGSPERYRALLAAGHELASHTMTHPCDRALGFMKPGMALQDFDQPRMDAELADSVKQLRELGQTGPLSFAYPCGSTWLGEAQTSYIPSIERSFSAARGVHPSLVDPERAALFDVPSIMGNTDAATLSSWLDQAVASHAWLVFIFHGVDGDYLSVTASAHEALLAYLEQHKSTIWTERFGTVARYVATQARHSP